MHLLNQYSAHQRVRGFSRRTIARREWSIQHWLRYLTERDLSTDAASVIEIEGFLSRWPSPQSRHSVRSDLRQFYAWAIGRGLLGCLNPTDSLPAPKIPERSATPIPPEQVRRVLDCGDSLTRLIVSLAAFAGLRISEIAALRGEDIDLAGRQLVVRNGKGGGDEVVPLADELLAELARWPRYGRLVPLTAGAVGCRIRRLLRRLDIAGRPHDLRHSFGTQAARRTNGNLLLVSRLMRHRQPTTTVRYIKWHTTGHEVVTGLYDDAA